MPTSQPATWIPATSEMVLNTFKSMQERAARQSYWDYARPRDCLWADRVVRPDGRLLTDEQEKEFVSNTPHTVRNGRLRRGAHAVPGAHAATEVARYEADGSAAKTLFALNANRGRSLLTVLGIVGISAVIAMTALSTASSISSSLNQLRMVMIYAWPDREVTQQRPDMLQLSTRV